MTFIRSLIFFVYMAVLLIVLSLIFAPIVALRGRPVALYASRLWPRWVLKGLALICGTTFEVRGAEKIPQGSILIASKHQSMWETLFFMQWFADPSVVIKKELLGVPLYGWYARICDMIPVDRDKGPSALKEMVAVATRHAAAGRPVIIFPEGTRRDPGAPPDYKPGIAAIYSRLGVPLVPVALNSGLYWQGFTKRRGKVIIEFLDPIPPGTERKTMMRDLEARIETASERLLDEAAAAADRPQNRLKLADI